MRRMFCLRAVPAVLLLLVLLFGTGCDPYNGKRPNDFNESTWICREYRLAITVSEALPTSHVWAYAADADRRDIYVIFNYGSGMYFYDAPDGTEEAQNTGEPPAPLLEGKCSFGKQRMTVKISGDRLFSGALIGTELTFERVDYRALEDMDPSVFN
ncbi:MAG: hypothetical protein K6F19_02340 [Oscillospiraceae bacterium]|nr:hypothetical protein [Oscillospiraceae bacterium]